MKHELPMAAEVRPALDLAALARVEVLKAAYLRRCRREMFPPPVITLGEVPRMRPRRREERHHFTARELNGHTVRAVPEEVRR
jgi:hypothetical protein